MSEFLYCMADVRLNTSFPRYKTCGRKAWKDGLCKIHHPDAKAEREKIREKNRRPTKQQSISVALRKVIEQRDELIEAMLIMRDEFTNCQIGDIGMIRPIDFINATIAKVKE